MWKEILDGANRYQSEYLEDGRVYGCGNNQYQVMKDKPEVVSKLEAVY